MSGCFIGDILSLRLSASGRKKLVQAPYGPPYPILRGQRVFNECIRLY